MKQSKELMLGVLLVLAFYSCGKYPDKKVDTTSGEHAAHNSAGGRVSQVEITGEGYIPLFLSPGYQNKQVDFDIKEQIVEIGGDYQYRALTFDGNFPAKTLVVEQGTLVRIALKNQDSEPHSLHTHVIKYKPESDGTLETATMPNQTRYYFWEVTQDTPPGFYPFHDHGGMGEGAQSRGLIGMVNVVKKGELSQAGFGILLHDINPAYLFSASGSPIVTSGGGGHGAGHSGGQTSASNAPAHLINGRFGDAPESRFTVKQGEKIRLGVVNLGDNIHNFHPHGNSFRTASGAINDTLELQPGAYNTVELEAQAKGDWMYHCHVPGHPEGGMWSRYVVE